MAATYTYDYFPIAVYADPGQVISLDSILSANFGSQYKQLGSLWAYTRSIADMTAADWSYWDPSHPAVSGVLVNGQLIPTGASVALPSSSNLANVSLVAGNSIAGSAELCFRLNSASSGSSAFAWDWIKVVPLRFQKDARVIPTPADIVNTALDFSAVYSGIPNDNDCGNMAVDMAAATGASMSPNGASYNPQENQDGGLWRVVYRGSDPNPVTDWQSLLQPGDIVRLRWAGMTTGHTFTALSAEQANGTVLTFDNGASGGSIMGLHYANYQNASRGEKADPTTITILRLSPDHRYLINADVPSATVLGTVKPDDIHATLGGAQVQSGDGDDLIRLTLGGNTIDGGSGTDTVAYGNARASATLTKTSTGWMVKSTSGATDVLSNVERIQFVDGSVAFDTSSNAGQVYRLYQAAFDRTPDKGGLGDWIYGMDNGASLLDVSAGFIASAEFKLVYGQNPTDSEVVTRFYQNVLHRAPEQAGYDYWMNQLGSGLQTRTQVLTGFSESPENQAQVIGVIQNGIEYTQHQA